MDTQPSRLRLNTQKKGVRSPLHCAGLGTARCNELARPMPDGEPSSAASPPRPEEPGVTFQGSFKSFKERRRSFVRSLSGVLPFMSTQPVEEDLNQEINDMRRTIRNYRRMIIHPRSSKWIGYWDAGAFACLLFTACVTPVEVCVLAPEPFDQIFGPDGNAGSAAVFVINRCIDLFFMTDILLNFFMAYQEPSFKGGMWVTARRRIACNYIQTWLLLDVLSVIPFDLIARPDATGPDVLNSQRGTSAGIDLEAQESAEGLGVLRAARVLRLARLTKLLRVLRASRIIGRWQNYFGLS